MEVPILKLDLEGVRMSVMTHLLQYKDEVDAMTMKIIEETLTEEWIEKSIRDNVRQTIREAINGIPRDYELKNAISEVIAHALKESISENYLPEEQRSLENEQ